ncbi:MAG: UDP-glucose 4-epimerase GalE [Labilithrix sp.]|nr:UDP-glucose 4-epimerase GalE [Labilithrix sp.]MCW5810818.1 UDP-glucose 4-epimerase GalE [Labilithrix sp.]
MKKVLVTGGAGYIGSHMVAALLEAGHRVTVLDDLSTGHREQVPAAASFALGDVANARELLVRERFDGVIHFAAKIRVEESVANPRLYFHANTMKSLALLDAMIDAKEAGAPLPSIVFSSTAAVYGTPESVPIDEDHPKRPESPYGSSKLAIEHALDAYGKAYGLRWAALRYFNAAGAHPEAGLGERHEPETHLIPIVLEVAAGERKHLTMFGTDWDTPDGTCVRDYIHVRDLAAAHLAAIEHLGRGGASGAFNCGTGKGTSVREIVRAVERVTGKTVTVVESPRRAGDPAVLVAKVDRAAEVLGWRAERTDLDAIVSDAWAFKMR